MNKQALLSCWKKGQIEAGCDEAGRGCLAGPVFAGAVILPDDYFHNLLNDSKKLSDKQRYDIRKDIEKEAIAWAVAEVDNNQIDEINILNASILAMHKAIEKLTTIPEFLLIDGNRFKNYKNTPHQTVIKGDGKYYSIAAASVLAKTYRDDFMLKIHQEYPQYDWQQNKGYPTKKHRDAITQFNITPYHRKSFRLVDTQLKLDL